MIVLVDSCAWIEYFQGSSIGEKVRCYVEDDQEIIVSAINMAEIYRWILRFYNQNIAEEKRNAIKDRCIIIDVDEEIAIDAARIKHNLGWGLGDSIIYATAKHENAMVLTCDSHFQGQESVIFLGRELNILGQR